MESFKFLGSLCLNMIKYLEDFMITMKLIIMMKKQNDGEIHVKLKFGSFTT